MPACQGIWLLLSSHQSIAAEVAKQPWTHQVASLQAPPFHPQSLTQFCDTWLLHCWWIESRHHLRTTRLQNFAWWAHPQTHRQHLFNNEPVPSDSAKLVANVRTLPSTVTVHVHSFAGVTTRKMRSSGSMHKSGRISRISVR